MKTETRDKAFIQEQESVSFKEQPFDPVGTFSAEQEEGALFQRIQFKLFLDQSISFMCNDTFSSNNILYSCILFNSIHKMSLMLGIFMDHF